MDRTALRGAQDPRLRQALVTIGVQFVRLVRRVVLHFSQFHRDAGAWAPIARSTRRPDNGLARLTPTCPRAGSDRADTFPLGI